MQLHWDIFCRVIDNYGDIGVCWRLARQLATEHGKRVKIWVDDLESLKLLAPAIDTMLLQQEIDQIGIHLWSDAITPERVGDVVIEAFACDLPAAYMQKMAAARHKPCWINLDYLTAEDWAENYHGMASPHPGLPLTKYFFFPGFSSLSGGLLRENGLLTRYPSNLTKNQLEISLFCYETAPVGQLVDALRLTKTPINLHVAPGKPLAAVEAHLNCPGPWTLDLLNIQPFAFLPQDDFDALLWRCDINFVRGEDSFVRAQWSGKPFIWQIYQQDDGVHLEKLQAFLEKFTHQWPDTTASATVNLFKTWNFGGDLSLAWNEYSKHIAEITARSLGWRNRLASQPDLTNRLVKFCAGKV